MTVEKDKVYTFKLTNADEIVGKVVDITEDAYVVAQPLSAVPTLVQRDQVFPSMLYLKSMDISLASNIDPLLFE